MKPQHLVILVVLLSVTTTSRLLTDIGRPATRWDEQTNIAVVRETLDKRSFPVLSYNSAPFFEKPPLWYYLNAGIGRMLGVTPIPMRMVSVIAGAIIIALSVLWVWNRYGSIAGLLTWVILLLSRQLFIKDIGKVFSSHNLNSADPDALQIVLMLLAFSIFTRPVRSYSWIVAGLATGLAVLTKGPLGFVPIIIATILPLTNGFPLKQTWTLSLAIISPWYLAMILTFGKAFLDTHIGYHLVTRAIFPIEGNGEPPWYFLGIIANPEIYPVFPLAALSVVLWFRMYRKLSGIEKYAGIITLLLLVIPSLMRTKLSWYILPFYPFLAILSGMMLSKVLKKSVR